MATNKKLSELTEKITIDGTDLLGISTTDGGDTVSRKVQYSTLKTDVLNAVPDLSAFVTPTGGIIPYAGSSVPSGWIECDGSAVNRTTEATLFAVIGVTYGSGDGLTTFNLPDLRGRTVIGMGQGSGLTDRLLAASGGSETHVLSEAELPAHTHSLEKVNVPNPFDLNNRQVATDPGANEATTGSTGSGTAHNNMQPFVALKYIIKN
jgi:microcystin-dependent protein